MQPQDLAETRHHPQHDLLLIAGFAADALTSATERAHAQALVHGCVECRSLRDDLVAISHATHMLAAIPVPAPRDFRITTEQAARLRRTGWLATLLSPFSSARTVVKPVATAFTTLGLAGLFIATVLPGLFGATALSALPEAAPGAGGQTVSGPTTGGTASEAPVPQFGPALASNVPGDQQGSKDSVAAPTSAPVYAQSGDGTSRDLGSNASNGSNPGASGVGRLDSLIAPANVLLVGSVAFLAVGLVLFGLRFAGRRLR